MTPSGCPSGSLSCGPPSAIGRCLIWPLAMADLPLSVDHYHSNRQRRHHTLLLLFILYRIHTHWQWILQADRQWEPPFLTRHREPPYRIMKMASTCLPPLKPILGCISSIVKRESVINPPLNANEKEFIPLPARTFIDRDQQV
jgi:hypothetical protein